MSHTSTYKYGQNVKDIKIKKTVTRPKYTHDLFCECGRCEPGIITKWRKISVKDLA